MASKYFTAYAHTLAKAVKHLNVGLAKLKQTSGYGSKSLTTIMMMKARAKVLTIKPISLKMANEFVINNHRHHDKVQGHKFSLSVWDGDKMCGVAIVGHPQSRRIDNDSVLEVLRLCTDGTYNACSILYARCARVGKDMGYRKIITYILASESGASLRASGWHCAKEKCGGTNWTGRREAERHKYEQMTLFMRNMKQTPNELKQMWVKDLVESQENEDKA